ncbi:MAG: hypothetical protein PHN66_03285 [Candidatus Shapirobacteria bacterium]|nr:hypothetical protein [Candidatus Shapirobacteria bacterium]
MSIKKIFNNCLLREKDDFNENNYVKVEGVVTIVIFNKNRLEKHRPKIEEELKKLPNFQLIIKNNKWDKKLERLLQLGIGLNIVKTPIYQKEKPKETIFYSIAS